MIEAAVTAPIATDRYVAQPPVIYRAFCRAPSSSSNRCRRRSSSLCSCLRSSHEQSGRNFVPRGHWMPHNSKLDDGRGVQRQGRPSQKQSHLDLPSSAMTDPARPRQAIKAAATDFIFWVPHCSLVSRGVARYVSMIERHFGMSLPDGDVEAGGTAPTNHWVSRSDMDWAAGRSAE